MYSCLLGNVLCIMKKITTVYVALTLSQLFLDFHRFSRSYEAFAIEFLENIEDMFL